jgi:hypothetical protein
MQSYILVLAIMFSTTILIGFVGSRIQNMQNVPITALKILRLIFSLMLTVGHIPISIILMGGMNCVEGVNVRTNLACSTLPQLPLLIMNVIACVTFLLMVSVGSLLVWIHYFLISKCKGDKSIFFSVTVTFL